MVILHGIGIAIVVILVIYGLINDGPTPKLPGEDDDYRRPWL